MNPDLVAPFIDAVEKLALHMPAPNPYTPQFMQMCAQMRCLLSAYPPENVVASLPSCNSDDDPVAALWPSHMQRKI